MTIPIPKDDQEKADHDYDVVRFNLQELIIKGTKALDEVGALAEQGQEARMYEVYSKMINSITDASKELLDLHKRKHAMKPKEAAKQVTNHNKNLIIASSSEVLAMIKNVVDDNKQELKQVEETKDDIKS